MAAASASKSGRRCAGPLVPMVQTNTEAFGYNQARLEISTLKLSGARRHGMLAPATVPGRWWCSLNAVRSSGR